MLTATVNEAAFVASWAIPAAALLALAGLACVAQLPPMAHRSTCWRRLGAHAAGIRSRVRSATEAAVALAAHRPRYALIVVVGGVLAVAPAAAWLRVELDPTVSLLAPGTPAAATKHWLDAHFGGLVPGNYKLLLRHRQGAPSRPSAPTEHAHTREHSQ